MLGLDKQSQVLLRSELPRRLRSPVDTCPARATARRPYLKARLGARPVPFASRGAMRRDLPADQLIAGAEHLAGGFIPQTVRQLRGAVDVREQDRDCALGQLLGHHGQFPLQNV